MDITDVVGDLIANNAKKRMNKVSVSDVTLMTLSLGSFAGVAPALSAHDYPVATGLLVLGVVLIYLYHKMGSATVA